MESIAIYFVPTLITTLVVMIGHCIYLQKEEVKNGWKKENDTWDGDDDA